MIVPPPIQGYLVRRWRFGSWGMGIVPCALVLMRAPATAYMSRLPTAYLPAGPASLFTPRSANTSSREWTSSFW